MQGVTVPLIKPNNTEHNFLIVFTGVPQGENSVESWNLKLIAEFHFKTYTRLWAPCVWWNAIEIGVV